MGKMMFFLTFLIIADILFIMVGALTPSELTSPSAIIVNLILNFKNLSFTQLFSQFLGDFSSLGSSLTGLAALGVGLGTIVAGTYFAPTDTKLFVPMAVVLGAIGADFVIYYKKMSIYNEFLAIIIFAPMTVIYVLTVIEWVRGRD